jgi:hypothetical protein
VYTDSGLCCVYGEFLVGHRFVVGGPATLADVRAAFGTDAHLYLFRNVKRFDVVGVALVTEFALLCGGTAFGTRHGRWC